MDCGADSDAEPVAEAGDSNDDATDTVTNEVSRWKTIDRTTINKHKDEDGLVNEFALLYELRTLFPLHYFLFRQNSLPHRA